MSEHQFSFINHPKHRDNFPIMKNSTDIEDQEEIKKQAAMPLVEDWQPPSNLPDLSQYKRIAVDLETRDPNLMRLGRAGCVRTGTSSALLWRRVKALGTFPSSTRVVATCRASL